ncbi:glycoside hydrolase family 99-like domain-containing protein [Primorskyibacter flagellatus]|uniref:glycoside hydrolase family 99-like domain-containing protein n=1 Tax=Primorskyibacter flagellatus TaxID=1387277 RepID=UPI003A91D94C
MSFFSKFTAQRIARFARLFLLKPSEQRYLAEASKSGLFDPIYYRGAYPHIHPLYHRLPLRHYIVYGERMGFRPNPDFSPSAYLRYNPDVAAIGVPAFEHWVRGGHKETRVHKELPEVVEVPQTKMPVLRGHDTGGTAPYAIVIHIYYPDLWEEFRETLEQVKIDHDLYITITYRGDETDDLASKIKKQFPNALVASMPNRGRDILPFVHLVNSGMLDSYKAVAKFHTKKSPHRADGDKWRRHLIEGILPKQGLQEKLDAFVADDSAGFWVADGQHFTGEEWWGSNFETTRSLMRRIEVPVDHGKLSFPAGSIYWVKPLLLGMIKGLKLNENTFEPEQVQVDGTLAHSIERALGFLCAATGQKVVQASQIDPKAQVKRPEPPEYVSAFYLPQFHPIPENDAWWGKGFTEWRSTVSAESLFPGHLQPMLPSDLGYYDLRATEVMGEQAELARDAGIDAFCVYHYWFDGKRVLEAPLNKLLEQPEIDFPFYLCWANESWRRNWDGLSGTVLLEQTYAKGFEKQLVEDSLPYMRDPRYQRPDGTRPRFVIYRPEDMPDPAASVAAMRDAWREAGIGEVELGAVCFHISGENQVADDLFDFWIEMAPHGMVSGSDYLFGGPDGNKLGFEPAEGFEGLIYDYNAVANNSTTPAYYKKLPKNTICGAMPSWDNTARRGRMAHIAYGANPGSFNRWLPQLLEKRVPQSYRKELFLNAWNEWAEKAVLEPSQTFGTLYLDVLKRHIGK